MKAAVVKRYGGPEAVAVVEVPVPVPRADEVLVRVVAASVNSGDARIRGADFPPGFGLVARLALGLRGPRHQVLGVAFSGVVEAVGADAGGHRVGALVPGDEVCGMTSARMGAHAEYVAVQAARLARTPATVSHDDAAGVLFGGTTALHFLQDEARVAPGQTVLVNGASGAVGTNAVQVARHLGATVTGVTSAANADLVLSLGGERTIDHHVQPVAGLDERFDVVFDAVGNLSIASGKRLLAPGGRLILAVAGLGETVRAHGRVLAGPYSVKVEHVEELLALVADGTLTVVHDRQFDLAGIVDAHRHVDTGHKVGNLIVHP